MRYIKSISLILVVFAASSCKKLLDINSDPATPQKAKAEYYLAPIIGKMAYNSALDYRDALSKLTQHMGNQAALDVWERQGYTASDVGGAMWRHVYINAGLNLEDMIARATEAKSNSLAGIGYAIKAWGFQLLTDQHGPIILDEAFADKLEFNYQDQPEVYAQVRVWCQMAIKHLNTPDVGDYTGILQSNDYMYQGDREKWKKFTYGLLALQYGHLVNKKEFASQYADSVIKYTNLSFTSTADDAMIGFVGNVSYVSDGSPGDSNPLSGKAGMIGGTAFGRIGQPIVNYLTGGVRGTPATNPKTSIDPRLTRMIVPMSTTSTTTNGVYRGVSATKGDVPATKTIPHVLGSTTPTASAPFPGKYIFGSVAGTDKPKYPLMTYSQLLFVKSEAQFLKGDKASAYTTYINAIRAHMDFVNTYGRNGTTTDPVITTAEINAYLASSEVAQSAATLTIADIMGQKYIAQWGWAGHEQWADLRKYHYDTNVFRQFKPLEAAEFFIDNSYAYRIRPRYNSEYIWNRKALEQFGGLDNKYTSKETWFSQPN